jgi:O-antigen ligase
LLVSPTRADAFDLPKLLASEWLGLASLAVLAWRLRGAGEIGWRRLAAVPGLAAVAPLLAVATVGLAASPHPAHVRGALPDLWIGAACLVGWSAGVSAATHRRLLRGLLAPASLLAVLAVLQFHGVYRPFAFAGGEEAERLGVSSLAGNPGVLGSYLVLPALIAQSWLRRAWGRRRALAAGAVAVVCLYGLAVTQTLAALAAVAAASAVLWLLAAPPRRAAWALGAAAVLAAAAIVVVAPLRTRVAAKVEQIARGEWNRVLTGRLDGWEAAVWMIARHPLLGVGHGAYDAEFVPARLDLAARGAPMPTGTERVMFVNAHDEFLEAGAEWGLAGLAALGWGLWRLVGALRRIAPGGKHGAPAARGADRALAWAGVTGLAVLAIFHFPFRVGLVAYPAVLFLAWTFRLGEEGGR